MSLNSITNLYRIETSLHDHIDDTQGKKTLNRIARDLNIKIKNIRQLKIFTVEGLDKTQVQRLVDEGIWHDPILQKATLGALPISSPKPDWFLEISFRPGVTDNEARTARETASIFLNIDRENINVYTSIQFRINNDTNNPLNREQIDNICNNILCNSLIQRYRIKSIDEWEKEEGFTAQVAKVTGKTDDSVNVFELSKMDDETLQKTSRENTWALNLNELKTIKNHFANPSEQERRKKYNLPDNPTDVEMEVLAQTWSEHCKHKIFASSITYTDKSRNKTEIIDNLYKTCIRDTTKIIRKNLGEKDFCKSVFKDNAGVIAFINGYDACIKVETHNSPSALDPYGGALTGIVGVNRDPLGTGLGAQLVCNTDVFCFASPFYKKEIPQRLLHPRRILEGVREGVEHGGNKSGIPTINGSLVFDERYLGKPLVYCGTVGILPATINDQPGWQKKAQVGDLIIMVGGRIGKDGIHGATFSSEELHEGSPATAVQIGDPITQRKMYDFILKARDNGLYNAITDNGAGGLSSSVGEMAEDTGGCQLDISMAPLKYDGLKPWEILLSEAQERMTLAVPPNKRDNFFELAKQMDVEATVLGNFTNSNYFNVIYKGKTIASLPMDFMHNGLPQLKLEATWENPEFKDITIDLPSNIDHTNFLYTMLERLNICSKEYIIRQYDHEVRGGSVIKPLVGACNDGPSDAGVFRPIVESDAGLVVSHGICPKFSDYDTYWMMANAIDEAIRNAVCVGANPDALAGVDNFCWCDPVKTTNNPNGDFKLAQLVRACKALSQYCHAFHVPCISGKDSMKNDYLGEGKRISIPPTVLFTILGVINNVTCTQSSDFKRAGDIIYILGGTWKEMAGSEAASEIGISGGKLPHVDANTALTRYRSVNAFMGQRAITSCHDCSDGGLAVSLAEMSIGGRLGCKIDINNVPTFEEMTKTEVLYSESASRLIITVRPDLEILPESLGHWQICKRIGTVTDNSIFSINSGDSTILESNIDSLANAFKKTLNW